MSITIDQNKSLFRSVVGTLGGALIGYFVGTGKITPDQVSQCYATMPDNVFGCLTHLPPQLASLASDSAILGYVGSGAALAMTIWGWVTHSATNTVAAANALPAVAGVVMTKTPEGTAIAKAIPSPTVAVAGTFEARVVSAPEPPPPPSKDPLRAA